MKKHRCFKYLIVCIKNNKEIFIMLVIAVSFWSTYLYGSFSGLTATDAMHYGTIARNIVRGNGMRADDVTVGEIAILKTDVFRGCRNAPLHPLIMATFFYLFGISDSSAAMSSAFFYFLSIPVVFLLGKQLFGKKVAWYVVLLYIINLHILYYSISGLAESLFTFLLLLSFYLLCRSSSPQQFFFVGVMLGLSRLVKVNAVFFVIPFLCYSWFFEKRRGFKNSLSLLTGFIIFSLPEMIRGYVLFGDPFFSGYAMGIYHFKYSSDQMVSSFIHTTLPGWQTIFISPFSFIKNYLTNLERHYFLFYSSMKAFVMSFFVAGVLRWYSVKRLNLFKATVFLSIIIQILMLSVSRQEARYFHVFIPLILIFSLEFMIDLFSKIRFQTVFVRKAAIVCLVIFLTYPFGSNLVSAMRTRGASPENTGFNLAKNILSKYTKPRDIILSDSAGLSWVADRKIAGLPLNVKHLKKLEEMMDIRAILLTNLKQGQLKGRREMILKEWSDALDNPPKRIGRYRLISVFENMDNKFILYYISGQRQR